MREVPVFTATELAEWSGGVWDGVPSIEAYAIGTHSGKPPAPGAVFIALKGEVHDAHEFVGQAAGSGYAAAMVRNRFVLPESTGNLPLLRVDDPNSALGRLANGYRRTVAPCTVGITGSVGKTTVKEMTAALLATLGPVARTTGNLNNEFGLPLSLLAMERDSCYGVFEIGMSNPGELAPLCEILEPQHGIVTNVGPVHIEAFDSEQAIAVEKATLVRSLPRDGVAVLDKDQPWFAELVSQAVCEIVTVSSQAGADFVLEASDPQSGQLLICERGAARSESLQVGIAGAHNIRNALLAVALARRLGVSWEAIRTSLPQAARLPMRWERIEKAGIQIINDAYNANLLSMKAALETFKALPVKGRKFALLGDMLQLGELEEEQHRELGRLAAAAGLKGLFVMGKRCATWTAVEAKAAGLENVTVFEDVEEAAKEIAAQLRESDYLLLKASRGMALERVVETLEKLQ